MATGWYIAAALVILRGEVSMLDTIHATDLSQDPRFVAWQDFADAIDRYTRLTGEPLNVAARRATMAHHRSELPPLVAAARQALDHLTRPGRFQFRAGRELVMRIDRDLARLGRVFAGQELGLAANSMRTVFGGREMGTRAQT